MTSLSEHQASKAADATAHRLSKLMRQARDDWVAQAKVSPLRRDMVTLLHRHERKLATPLQ